MAASAPKIVSMEIPIDKIGEVIGPKGKVINTLQQETGADIAVDDDGVVGTVTIGAKDGNAVEEARRRISLILDPPTADVGAVYAGKVVNITKFGAFVNVLPGRDGLLHISKLSSLAGGKRINNVEDVLILGQPVEVRVDDIDPQGKVSLSLASVPEAPRRPRAARATGNGDTAPSAAAGPASTPASASTSTSAPPSRTPSRPSWWRTWATWAPGRPRPRAGGATAATAATTAVLARAFPPSLIETSVLPCGIRLVTETMADVRSVAVAYWVGTGSRDEPGELAGASHFLEHLLFKGTAARSAAAIAEELDEVGGDCNAYTTKEYTTFYVRLLSDHLALGLDILSDIMWEPALRPDDIEAERTVILDEILMHADEPADLAVSAGSPPSSRTTRSGATPSERRRRCGARRVRTSRPSSRATTGPPTWSSRSPATAGTSPSRPTWSVASPGPRAARRRPAARPGPTSSPWTWRAGRPSRHTSSTGCARSPASTSGAGRWRS